MEGLQTAVLLERNALIAKLATSTCSPSGFSTTANGGFLIYFALSMITGCDCSPH